MLKTSEAVTPAHPDKVCDHISDAILDACLEQDKNSRVAIETMGGHNLITITGELTTKAEINIPDIVRKIVGDNYGIQTNIVRQSIEIAQGVDNGGAGDQGIMIGYACSDNSSFIPQESYLAKSLARYIYEIYPNDGKVQITLEGSFIKALVLSFCGVGKEELSRLFDLWLEKNNLDKPEKVYINSAGDWTQGGFSADTGLTGRKIACDNYGPQIPIGGGAFSGKDSTKVDRSGAYMARKIAVDLLKKNKAKEVLVKLAYSIGVAEPIMVTAEIINQDDEKEEIEVVGYDLTPRGIISFLHLDEPKYKEVAKWGSFGNGFSWDE